LAARDEALLQRDKALTERDKALIERDNAFGGVMVKPTNLLPLPSFNNQQEGDQKEEGEHTKRQETG
ncbi:unnamed protein product, partial [Brassica rapa subsp. trilocularis]